MGGCDVTAHLHLTRDMRPLGECPACDEYHRYVPEDVWYPAELARPAKVGPGAGLAIVLVIGLCLLAGVFVVWFVLWLGQSLTATS